MTERRASRRTSRDRPRTSRTIARSPEPNVPKMFRGLSSRMESGGGSGTFGLKFDYNKPKLVQFLFEPEEGNPGYLEFDQHQFMGRGGGWNYIPCLGDECPLCEDEDSAVSKTTYRFVTPVYSFDDKEVRMLEGPKTLAQRIAFRWSKPGAQAKFLRRTFEITKLKAGDKGFVQYDVDTADDRPISTRSLEIPDVEEYVKASAQRFFGDADQRGTASDRPRRTSNRSSLDADDDDEMDEDSPHTQEELMDMDARELKDLARTLRINPAKYTKRRELVLAIMKKER